MSSTICVVEGSFDVVFTSYGVLWWLPDLPAWGRCHRSRADRSALKKGPVGRYSEVKT